LNCIWEKLKRKGNENGEGLEVLAFKSRRVGLSTRRVVMILPGKNAENEVFIQIMI